MRFTTGTRLGHYEIVNLLGEGGMGEVYAARDGRLDRSVAIKVLHPWRPDAQRRLIREARAVAALQHPHICTLHDVGSHDGVDYLVMEHVDGVILKGPLPLPKVIEYGVQIADALDAAHRQQITHRDLKPSNIKVTRSGVKLLDFGIARMTGDDTVTQPGITVGSPAYMAPEQWAGASTDARTDIYALGCVLREMASGRNDPAQRIEPDALDMIVRGCVAEQPDDRWQSARDVRRLLQSIDTAPPKPAVRRERWPWFLAAALAIAAVVPWMLWLSKPQPDARAFHLSIAPPRDSAFVMARNYEGGVALSPDGTMVAFVARTGGHVQLWIQRLDSAEARPLPGTERAYLPFWSPDSRQIAFYTPNSLKKVAIAGGPVQTICQTDPRAPGGAWMAGDTLLVTGRPGGGIHRISAGGGNSERIVAGAWPHALPDGRHFLIGSSDAISVASLDGADAVRRVVDARAPQPVYSSGHVLFVRDGALVAQRFDPGSLQVSGQPIVVAPSVQTRAFGGQVSFSATRDGVLVYAAGEPLNRLRWRDRAGTPLGDLGEPGQYLTPRISPDGRRVAFSRTDASNTDIWIAGPDRAAATRFTFDAAVDLFPVWSPDGAAITFASGPIGATPGLAGSLDFFRKAADGSGGVEQLTFDRGPQHAMDWSSDGLHLSFTRNNGGYGTDLNILPASGTRTPYLFLQTGVSEAHSQFGPGIPPRWIAYSSDDSGRREIYVTAFAPGQPASPARWQISRDGGTTPRWRGDGRELFYWGLDGRIMAVEVNGDGPAFRAGAPAALFQMHTPMLRTNEIEFDVTRDGRRFVFIEPAEQTTFQSLSLITNWPAAAR